MPGGLKKGRSTLAAAAAIVLVATLIVWFIALFALNRSAAYGGFNIPGNAVVQLPAGEVDLAFDAQVTTYGGNSNVSLPIPNLGVSVVPVGGGLVPGYENSVGSTTSVNSDAHIRHLRNSNSGWNITTTASGGQPGPTFSASLDGTGVERVR